MTAIAAAACSSLLLVGAAQAHNAGHFFLPDGSCHEVGSFKDAPLVGPDRTELDLIPATPTDPYDEYGASFAAFQGQNALLPGGCPR